MLFEAIEEEGCRTFWITRRAAMMVVKLFGEQLGLATSSSKRNVQEATMMSAFERDIVASRNPPQPGKLESPVVGDGGVVALAVGVLKTLSFTPMEGDTPRYKIVFSDVEDNRWGFETDRNTLLKIQEMLVQQIERAEW